MAVSSTQSLKTGTPAPPFALPGTDGKTYSLDSFADARALVVIFTCNHCPYAVACEDRFIDLARRFGPRGVAFVAINPNDPVQYPEDSFENMRIRAREKNFPFPYLFDETQDVARAYDAACTPDIFVLDERRRVRYNGRLDDNWKDPGRVTRHELETALEDILAGRDLSFDPVPSIGCSIKWKSPA
jgi:peroxiredoxin